MATNFGEKYGIENYNIKLKNQNDAIMSAIKNESLSTQSIENAVKYFMSDVEEGFYKLKLGKFEFAKFAGDKLKEYLKFRLENFFEDKVGCNCVLQSSTGHMYFKRFYKYAFDMGKNIDEAVGYNILGKYFFLMPSLVIDFNNFDADRALLVQELNKDISFYEDQRLEYALTAFFNSNKDIVNCFIIDPLRNAIRIVGTDKLWGPVNKKMLEDMFNDEKIYKEYMSQFKLFTEVK